MPLACLHYWRSKFWYDLCIWWLSLHFNILHDVIANEYIPICSPSHEMQSQQGIKATQPTPECSYQSPEHACSE